MDVPPKCPECHLKSMRWRKATVDLWLCSTATCSTLRVRRDPGTLHVLPRAEVDAA